ncbi:MAG: type II toxin-antitoxin system HicA family toxin [Deltaproteobacteria bacterium]|nr:type II toxin-antitoxin system HicA family toxin [Deltaproteobacteria bacterium]
MPALTPRRRREFIYKLRSLGYDGPYAGGKHRYMSRSNRATKPGAQTITVPNTDLDIGLLKRILRNAKIDEDDFINA